MLTGQRADGTPYALIGRDALLQTTLHHSRLDSERIAALQEKMERDGEFRLHLNEEEWLGSHYTFQKGHDTEVDLILLEAANLLPQGLDEPQRHAFARTARQGRARQVRSGRVNPEAAEQRMLLSPQQGGADCRALSRHPWPTAAGLLRSADPPQAGVRQPGGNRRASL